MFEKKKFLPALILYYVSLNEFGKGVLLRDKAQMAKYKKLTEIDTSDFFNFSSKQIKAGIITAGPNSNFIEFNKSEFQEDSFEDILKLVLLDYDNIDKWVQKDLTLLEKEQKKAFVIFDKMIYKWETIYKIF